MTTTQANPGRPPKHWMRRCIKGVTKGKSAADPGAVCGSLWHHKLSDAQKRAILKEERAMGGLVENPACGCAVNPRGKQLWIWNWKEGGYNSTMASSRAGALQTAKRLGAPRRVPYGKSTIDIVGLTIDEKSLHVGTYEELERFDFLYRANPSDPYRTWLMGVRRQLQRTGYPSTIPHKYERDLRGVYLSGASTTEGAKIMQQVASHGGYAENPAGGTVLAIAAALGLAGVVAWLVLRKPAEAAAAAPGGKTRTPASPSPGQQRAPGQRAPLPPATACEVDKGKLQVFAQSKGMVSVWLQGCVASQTTESCWDGPKGAEPSGPPGWATLWNTVLKMDAPTVPVLLVLLNGGTFWTYSGSPPEPTKRDDLRTEYCQFAAGQFTPTENLFPLQGADPASLFII